MGNGIKILIIVLAVVIVGGAAFAFTRGRDYDTQQTGTTQQTEQTTQEQAPAGEEPAGDEASGEVAATITYTDSGFEVDNQTVPAGSTIKVVNNSQASLEFASDVHPTHQLNSEFNFGNVQAGASGTFTVNEAGTWGFHNHLVPNHTGEITVE